MIVHKSDTCEVWKGFLNAVDVIELTTIAEGLDFLTHSGISSGICSVFGDVPSGTFDHDSAALAYIINDLIGAFKDYDFNVAFVRRIGAEGQSLRTPPFDNEGAVVMVPFGSYNGGDFEVDGLRRTAEPTDVLVVSCMDKVGRGVPYKIHPTDDGVMYVLSLHNLMRD